jgi:hypothetical protein
MDFDQYLDYLLDQDNKEETEDSTEYEADLYMGEE